MRARSGWAAVVAACALVGAGLATSADAVPKLSGSTLVITAYDSTSSGIVDEVTLKCDPTGGSHTTAEDACATLESVDGQFEDLDPLLIACPLYYQPVTIEVGGNWRDRVVTFDEEYPNMCVAMAESDGVFRFEDN